MPDGDARLCAEVLDGVCVAGARILGPVPDGEEDLHVDGIWFVFVEDGVLVDPIRAR
jgi:hypothetical protein